MKKKVGMPGSAENMLAMYEVPEARPGYMRQRVILVSRYEDDFVVSTQNSKTVDGGLKKMKQSIDDDDECDWSRSWNQGHYFNDRDRAKHAFIKNVARGHVTSHWGSEDYEEAYDLVCDQLITGLTEDGLVKALKLVRKVGK